jgi:hypothetical protein
MYNFFGYGANRSKYRIKEITGRFPIGGYSAIVRNYCLCYQKLTHIPDPPREILRKIWGEDFRCYTLFPHPGIVTGVIWELDENGFDLMKKWEFIGPWKELVTVEAITFQGKTIPSQTEIIHPSQTTDIVVDGINYETFINSPSPNKEKYEEQIKEELQKVRQMLSDLKTNQ